jgi:tetraacyldisaccharide 4'-kinase
MHAPLFWKNKTKLSTALLPAAAIYKFFAGLRQGCAAVKLHVPVICIGNVVVGGSGKTPVALALGELLRTQGKNAHYLTRGYKGILKGPVRVDPLRHTALEVGDEPLLLAEILPTWVAKDRVEGARAAIAEGAELIIMDDGFQNPALHKDISLLVIDGVYGFGNKRLLPAGPLREPVADAMKRASAIVLMGEDEQDVLKEVPLHLPVLRAHIEPLLPPETLKDIPLLAFAGIARPRKFYRTLQQLGYDVRNMVAYPDHYLYKPRDLAFLRSKAKILEAKLVTTSKDYVRLPQDIRAEVTHLPIKAVFDDSAALLRMVLS